MATGENQPSLYGALYKAMTDSKLIGDLLRHPEFRRQAEQICYRIAGPAGGEDLLQEACRRVSERVSQLNPNSIRNEGEFLGWFSQLARRVHLSRVLSAAAVSSCTEKAAGWPDALADVPPDEMGRFLTHADACPYHTRLLHASDEKLRAIFRRARGLDSQGRILRGAELQTSIAEHRRRLQNWRDAAFKKGRLFGHVALFNGGREIASCGKFYDFSMHISRNELDPYAGLQIRGVTNSNPDEDVLLGFYALAGVCHEGREEKTLDLDNGYTVGLRVKQVTETTFDIYFRCVETGKPSAVDTTDGIVIDLTDDERLDSSSDRLAPPLPFPLDAPVPPESAGWWPLSPGGRAAAGFALMLIVAVPCLLLGKQWGRIAAGDMLLAQVMESPTPSPLPGQTPTVPEEESNPHAAIPGYDSDSAASAGRSTQGAAQTATTPDEALTRRDGGRGTRAGRENLSTEAGLRLVTKRLYTGKPATGVVPHLTVVPRPRFNDEVEDLRATPIQLWSYDDRWDSADNSRRTLTNASLQNASYGGHGGSADISVLHFATNDKLVRKIEGALKVLHLRVEPVTEQKPETARFRAVWDVRTTKSEWDKRSFAVELNVYIYKEGETKSVHHDSYRGVGDNLDAAYGDAVAKSVKPVVDWIRNDIREGQSALAGETGGAEQHGADATEGELVVEHRDGDVNHPDSPETGTSGRENDVNVEPEDTEEKYWEE